MSWFGNILLWIVAIAWVVWGCVRWWLVVDGPGQKSEEREARLKKMPRVFVLQHVLPFIALLLVFQSFYIVDAGHAAAIKRLGQAQNGTYGPGPHLKTPFIDEVVDYRTQLLDYETSDNPGQSKAAYTDNQIETMTEDGQKVTIRYTVNFQIDPSKLGYIVQNIGDENDLVERIVKANSRSEGRNVPKSFSASDIYGKNVYKVESAIFSKLQPVFAANGVILKQFLLRQTTFDTPLTDALERKRIAIEDQATSLSRIQVASNEASAAIARASGEAQSIDIIQKQLSKDPNYSTYVLNKGIADGKTGITTLIMGSGGVQPVYETNKK